MAVMQTKPKINEKSLIWVIKNGKAEKINGQVLSASRN